MAAKRTEFTVQGFGTFPFDMLRYDQCWPKSEKLDSTAIERSTRREYPTERVTLLSDAPNVPTTGRWRSFGWTVTDERSV